MCTARIFVLVSIAFIFAHSDLRPANAFMEKVGKETIDSSLEKLKGLQSKLVRDVFDEGNKLIEKLINEASNERKSAIMQVGSEFRYAVTALTTQFGRETRGTISQASAEFQNNLAILIAWIGSIEDVTRSVSALEDDFAIDIQSLPFVTKHFSIRRVSGINIVQGERSTYPIKVTGEKFGRPDSGETIVVRSFIGEKELPSPAILGPNQLQFQIPSNLLVDHFRSTEVNLIDLKVVATKEESCFLSFLRNCTQEVSGTFKLMLTPERIGRLEIQIRRPKHDWTPSGKVVRQVAVKAPATIPLDALVENNGRKRRYGSPTVTCTNIKRDAWKLPNGRILLPEDKLLSDGWSSSSWIGSNRGKDLERFDFEAMAALGFTLGFYGTNSCATGQHCNISAEEIRRRSTKLSELGHCDIMKVAAIDLSPDRERGSITIVGTAEHESLFEISAPIETYERSGFETDPASETKDIFSTRHIDVEVPADTLVSLVFRAFDGITRDGRLPLNPPRGLKIVQTRSIDGGAITSHALHFARDQ